MRSFVAVPVPEPVRLELAEERDRLGRTFPPARWVPTSNLHLTLRFLGEVPAPEVARLAAAVRSSVVDRQPFEVTLGERGAFPSRGRPRVLWIGFEPSRMLTQLREGITRAVEGVLELEREARPFHPHLTLARCRSGWSTADAERWRRLPCGSSGETFTVTYVDLMESRLTPRGANHRRVERLTLGS